MVSSQIVACAIPVSQHVSHRCKGLSCSEFLTGSTRLVPTQPIQRRCSRQSSLAVEAGFFIRIKRVVSSYAESVVSSVEDPEQLLDQTVREMEQDLANMKLTSASVVASKKRMEQKFVEALKEVNSWYSRAQLAMEQGDENLAREALKRRKSCQENAESLHSQLQYQMEAVQHMVKSTRELEAQIQEAKSKKATLKARAQSAKASKKVSLMTGGLNTSSSMEAFERMEEKVIQLESQAEALSGMIEYDDLERKFASLEGGSVEADLEELKSKPMKDAIEFELDELRRKAGQ
eukprot:g4676.t1